MFQRDIWRRHLKGCCAFSLFSPCIHNTLYLAHFYFNNQQDIHSFKSVLTLEWQKLWYTSSQKHTSLDTTFCNHFMSKYCLYIVYIWHSSYRQSFVSWTDGRGKSGCAFELRSVYLHDLFCECGHTRTVGTGLSYISGVRSLRTSSSDINGTAPSWASELWPPRLQMLGLTRQVSVFTFPSRLKGRAV